MTTPETNPDRFARRVLARIEGERVTPRPRWEFIARNYAFWGLGALAVALGAFAFSAALFEVANAGWRFYAVTHPDFLTFFLAAAPFLWVFALAIFIAFGYVIIRRTKQGYRYPLAVIALGAVLTSVALGAGLYAAGLGGEIEEAVGDHPPFYRPILLEEHHWWLSPEKGLLGGTLVSEASSTNTFVLRDFSGALWTIDTSDVRGGDLIVLSRGGTVRVVGVPATASTSLFHACFILPWNVAGLSDEAPPPPLFVPASTSEISAAAPRSEECKGIRPYTALRVVENGF